MKERKEGATIAKPPPRERVSTLARCFDSSYSAILQQTFMAAPTVYTDVAEGANLEGQLFTSKKFWVAQHVPSRNRFLELIRSNGGEVVPLEKKADYLIADHCRKNCPPGSISYTFIEKSIASSEIVDPDEHLAGPRLGAAREVGSISRPAKGGRAAFTAEEDRILYTWVRDHERQGGTTSGNELYKQLESKACTTP